MNLSRLIKRCIFVLLIGTIIALSMVLIQGSHHAPGYRKARLTENATRLPLSANGSSSIPILLWWDSVYTSVDDIRTCGSVKCRVTNNRGLQQYPGAKVFLFYGSNFRPYSLPLPRRSEDIWALIHEESPRNAYIFSHNGAINIFNITSSYNRNANYPITTQWLQCSDWLWDTAFLVSLEDKNKLRRQGMAPVLYLHSDCGVPSDRDHYVKMLQRYISVDSYGTCIRNKKLPERLRFRDTMAPLDDVAFFRWAARYKFTMAMENYACNDYVTEKLWRPLRLGSIPIVFGAPNVRDFLPDNNSAVLVDDFDSLEELAEYIHQLDTNDSLYLSHLQFKTSPLQSNFLKEQLRRRDWNPRHCKKTQKRKYNHQSIFDGFECHLCRLIHNAQTERRLGVTPIIFQANSSHYACPSPRKFNEHGKYNVYSEVWTEEWNYGKYEALAMLRLIEKNKVVTKKEFDRLVNEVMRSGEYE